MKCCLLVARRFFSCSCVYTFFEEQKKSSTRTEIETRLKKICPISDHQLQDEYGMIYDQFYPLEISKSNLEMI